MKRYNIVLVILMICCNGLFAQYASDAYLYPNVLSKHKVDSVIITEEIAGVKKVVGLKLFNSKGYLLRDDDIDDNFYRVYLYHKDTQLTSSYFYSKEQGNSAELIEKDTYIYNASGLLIKESTSDVFSNNMDYCSVNYEYVNGELSSSTYYLGSDLRNHTKYSYDSFYSIRVETSVDFLNKTSKTYFSYDKENRLTGFRIEDKNGKTIVSHKYKTDSYGRRTEFEAFDSKGVLSQFYKMTYDSKGLLLFEESWVEIKNGNIKRSEYSRKAYTYHYRL